MTLLLPLTSCDTGELKQPRRQRQWKPPQICIFDNEKQYFCTLCTCIFHFWIFWRRSRSFYDVKGPDLQFCGRREHMMTNVQYCLLIGEALVRIWFQDRTHFSSIMTSNNRVIITETRSYIFRWRSRCCRRCVCLSSLLNTPQWSTLDYFSLYISLSSIQMICRDSILSPNSEHARKYYFRSFYSCRTITTARWSGEALEDWEEKF